VTAPGVPWPCWLAGQGCDLDQVVGEDTVPAPDRGSLPAIEPSAAPGPSPIVRNMRTSIPSAQGPGPSSRLTHDDQGLRPGL